MFRKVNVIMIRPRMQARSFRFMFRAGWAVDSSMFTPFRIASLAKSIF